MSVPSNQALRAFLIAGPAARRHSFAQTLVALPETTLIGQSEDPLLLMDPNNLHKPDLVVLEVGASRMDAALLVRRLTKVAGVPILVLSDSATLGSALSLALFEAGAIDVLPGLPPSNPSKRDATDRLSVSVRHLSQILRKEKAARLASPAAVKSKPPCKEATEATASDATVSERKAGLAGSAKQKPTPGLDTSRFNPRQLIVLGASTGGTEAIKDVLTVLPQAMPGICIVQHIPAAFSRSFAQRLNSLCALEVREAEQGDVVRPGLALVAPGGFHMELSWEKTHYVVKLHRGAEEHHQRPAVDVLFRSAAQAGGQHVLGVLLTGMGKDGALGMKSIKEAGGINLAQDDKSCVVFGMPAAAQELGVVHHVVSLKDMARAIERRVRVASAAVAA